MLVFRQGEVGKYNEMVRPLFFTREVQKGLQDTENLFRKNLQLKDVC